MNVNFMLLYRQTEFRVYVGVRWFFSMVSALFSIKKKNYRMTIYVFLKYLLNFQDCEPDVSYVSAVHGRHVGIV
jgi:hypothetical protein